MSDLTIREWNGQQRWPYPASVRCVEGTSAGTVARVGEIDRRAQNYCIEGAPVAATDAPTRDLVARTGHIHLGLFPRAGSDDRRHHIDGAARLVAGCGVKGLPRAIRFGRSGRRWRSGQCARLTELPVVGMS